MKRISVVVVILLSLCVTGCHLMPGKKGALNSKKWMSRKDLAHENKKFDEKVAKDPFPSAVEIYR